MFNLEDIELDFDDDFSSNIFSKKVPSDKKNQSEEKDVKQKQNVPIREGFQSFSKFSQEAKPESPLNSKNFLNSPLRNVLGENCLKRPHAEDEKPQKKKLSHEGLLQRRFPGPAGLLPDKPFKDIAEVSLIMEKPHDEEEENLEKEKSIIYSQCSGSVFLEPGYQKLVNEFNLNESDNPLNRYTVEWVKKTALNKGLQGRKIPFLGLVVHTVNLSMPDPLLILRDPTGEITGSLHREVWAEIGGKLRNGVALALRQVGVLITGVIRRHIYLNITMNNILAVYSSSENEDEVEITTVNRVSKTELKKNFAEWLAPSKPAPAHAPSPPSFPFTTIDGSKRSSAKKNETREVFDDFGIVFSDVDFNDEIGIRQNDRDRDRDRDLNRTKGSGTSTQVLSPAESQIFEEVLSGINLDEFEM